MLFDFFDVNLNLIQVKRQASFTNDTDVKTF